MIKGLRKNSIVFALVLSFIASLFVWCGNGTMSRAEELYPTYDGEAVVEYNDNVPQFTKKEITTTSFEAYGKLDKKGRCTAATACIGEDLMPTEERGSIGMIKPTGWKQNKYPGLVDSTPPYLYNRCHLIGYQLTGENANEKNLITGTRYFNVECMLPYENMVADYIKDTGNHVMYRVTPIFAGDDLLALGVKMEGYSVEDDGKGISFNVICYNVQPGVLIDYSDGSNEVDPDYDPDEVKKTTETTTKSTTKSEDKTKSSSKSKSASKSSDVTKSTPATDNTSDADYIANTNTKKFHYPSCSSVSDMKEKNKWYFHGDREELIEKGYSPCKRCNP